MAPLLILDGTPDPLFVANGLGVIQLDANSPAVHYHILPRSERHLQVPRQPLAVQGSELPSPTH
ncbi:MAG TPA: hypothetical protein VFZ90_00230, partial [Gemmatimonadales bacterium]